MRKCKQTKSVCERADDDSAEKRIRFREKMERRKEANLSILDGLKEAMSLDKVVIQCHVSWWSDFEQFNVSKMQHFVLAHELIEGKKGCGKCRRNCKDLV